jgi:hypothetical protein
MKGLVFLLTLLVTTLSFAQNSKGESNNLSIFSAPGTYIDFGHKGFTDDGFNIGVNYDHQNRTIYVGGQVFYFPELNNINYAHVIGRFGFNKEWGRFNKLRLFAGGRAGFIYREGGGMNYVMLGGELGVQYTFKGGLFFQVAGSRNERTDSQLWSNRDSFTTNSLDFGVGLRF